MISTKEYLERDVKYAETLLEEARAKLTKYIADNTTKRYWVVYYPFGDPKNGTSISGPHTAVKFEGDNLLNGHRTKILGNITQYLHSVHYGERPKNPNPMLNW